MKFRFIGNPNGKDLRRDITAFGYVFDNGEVVEVTDEHAIGKLSNNNHFEAVDGDDAPAAPRRGRPPKVKHGDENEG